MWKKEFEVESERLTVSINDVMNDPDGMEFKLKIALPSNSTLAELKEKIAGRFSIDVGDFYLVKNFNDQEIKGQNKSLAMLGVTNDSMIKVVLGKSKSDGGFNVKLCRAQLT